MKKEKTVAECAEDLLEALNNLILEIAYSLKIDKVLDKVIELLDKLIQKKGK